MTPFKTLFFCATIFWVSCAKNSVPGSYKFTVDKTIIASNGMNLVGRVTDGKTFLSGVVVSDGYTCTVTNHEGVYQMKANDNAKFVFVSVPSDCEIPLHDGLPKIYVSLEGRDPRRLAQCNFDLKKSVKQTNFFLLALADVQIANSTDLSFLQSDIPKIKSHIQSLEKIPLYGISLGDLVWDNMPYFSDYAREIKKLNIPIFQVIGNHDHNKSISTDEMSSKDFEKAFGPANYSYNIGDCHFVVMDDVYYTGNKEYKGRLTTGQLEWLKQDLSFVPKNKMIILGVHIPTKRRQSSTQVTNNTQLYDILAGYNVKILSGHTHNNFTTTIANGIEENTLGAVSGAFWTGDICNDGSPKGFAVYKIEGNRIADSYYKGTATDRSYQIKLYRPGQAVSATYKEDFIINIFSWHTNWTVKVAENGGPFKLISNPNIKEYDPAAFDLMEGATKPSYRTYADPEKNNDHLFYYHPSDTCNYINVQATDSYGNVYNSSISRK